MNNYNLSIVMPVYNSSIFLEKTVDSFIHQSYRNWELILVDDFSQDDSLSIAEKLSKTDSRIKPFGLEKNRGVAYARHFGNLKASGEILVVADSDDQSYPERLEVINHNFSQNPEIDVFYSNILVWDQKTGEIQKRFFQPFDKKLLYQINYIPNPSSAYRKAAYQRTQGYDEELRIGEDYDLWLQMAENQSQFLAVEQPLVKYARHAGALTAQQKGIPERQSWIKKIREKHQITTVDLEYVKQNAQPEVVDFFVNDPYFNEIWFGDLSIPKGIQS